MQTNTRLILALDVTEEKQALSISKTLAGTLDAIKINYPLVLGCGPEIITKISKFAPVICDFKVADIPNTNRLIVEQAIKRGADGVIVHGFVGADSVKACIEAAKGKDVYVVAEMSHPGGVQFTAPIAERLAKLAVEVCATGVIAPATRPERIRRIREIVGTLKILTPGVGTQGGSAADAIKAGADLIIVGRSIYEDKNPKEVATRIVKEIENTLG